MVECGFFSIKIEMSEYIANNAVLIVTNFGRSDYFESTFEVVGLVTVLQDYKGFRFQCSIGT